MQKMENAVSEKPGVSESRFNMWRAVFALAHVDGRVVPEEFEFMARYLNAIPFSETQRKTLMRDMEKPGGEIGAFLEKVTETPDQADFFQFARMICWCDSDYNTQEEAIYDMFLREQLEKFNIAHMRKELNKTRELSLMKLLAEDEKFQKDANEKVGLKVIIPRLFGDLERDSDEGGLTRSRFYMWRTVFALAHADNLITSEERQYLENVLKREPFSEYQRNTLIDDMMTAQDVGVMFVNITDQHDRAHFFEYARELCWCDGDYAKQEQEIMTRLNETHVNTVDFNQVLSEVDLSFDNDDAEEDVAFLAEEEEDRGEARSSGGLVGGVKRFFGFE